jgi:hypothetical protein
VLGGSGDAQEVHQAREHTDPNEAVNTLEHGAVAAGTFSRALPGAAWGITTKIAKITKN